MKIVGALLLMLGLWTLLSGHWLQAIFICYSAQLCWTWHNDDDDDDDNDD
jgi:hypothetical protein